MAQNAALADYRSGRDREWNGPGREDYYLAKYLLIMSCYRTDLERKTERKKNEEMRARWETAPKVLVEMLVALFVLAVLILGLLTFG